MSSTDRELKHIEETDTVLSKLAKNGTFELEIEYGCSSLKNLYLTDFINVIELLLLSQMWYSGQNGQSL